MTAPGLRQIRKGASRSRREQQAVAEVDALFHSWCDRPHEAYVCESNPRAGKRLPLPPMGARWKPQLSEGRAA